MAILGLLAVEPMSGYDLKKVCDQSLGHFWHASFGNLYPRLKLLFTAGHVRRRRQARKDAPDAFVYTLQPSGRAKLRKWMREPPAPERVHSEFVLKIFFGSHASLSCIDRMLTDHEGDQERIRDSLKVSEQSLQAEIKRPEAAYWMMALRRGQLLNEARLRWCEEARVMLAEMRNREDTHEE